MMNDPVINTTRCDVKACQQASMALASLTGDAKNALLESMADSLVANQDELLEANQSDMRKARDKGTGEAMLDRLLLTKERIKAMAEGLRFVASLPDPVGRVTQQHRSAKGFEIERVRVPLGVIAMIYEARPNVTADAAALCLKAGNGVILRGGSLALASNQAIAACLHKAMRAHHVDEAALLVVTDTSHATVLKLLQMNDLIDLVIPRGGEGLIRFVDEHSRIPVIKHYKGVCHLYVDKKASLDQAIGILVDGKCSRPATCNSLETLLVHKDIASDFLPKACAELAARGVSLLGDTASCAVVAGMAKASDADYAAEFLALKLAIKVVTDTDQAIEHIRHYGSDHTEVIATQDKATAERFIKALRAAVVMVNTSSRFSDGGELGLGAEIGISTTRLHAYGPMGLDALTIERFVLKGHGEVRHPGI